MSKKYRILTLIEDYPNIFAVYQGKNYKFLKDRYRLAPLKNYLIFYSIDEKNRMIKIKRIIMAKRDLTKV